MSTAGHTVVGRKLGDITNVKEPSTKRKSTAKQVKANLAFTLEERNYSQLIVEDNIILGDNLNMTEQQRPNPVPPVIKEDFSNLLMEKAYLLRILAAKDQIIEHNNVELQKLRMVLQKLQQQNWQLAQANTRMLAELNIGKDKLKFLKHKLTCTVAVLRENDISKKDKNQQPNDDVVTGDESHLDPCIPKLLSLSTTQKEPVKGNDDTKRRSKRKQSISSKFQICEHKATVNSNEPSDEDQKIQLNSSLALSEVENHNSDDKTLLIKAETAEEPQEKKSLALPESQVIRRSSRRQSSDVKLEAYEPELPINLNDSSEGEQHIQLVTSANTNLNPASSKGKKQTCNTKTLQVNAEMGKRHWKRKFSAPSQVVEVPCSKLRRSRNTEPEPCQRACVPKLPVNVNNTVVNPEHVQLVSLDNSVEGKEQVSPSEGQALPTTLGRRKLSAPSQSLDLPTRSSLGGRPSRRATIGISYKEIPLKVKMRRNT